MDEFTDAEKRVIRMALARFASYCWNRSSEMAQSSSIREPYPNSWIYDAMDTGDLAGKLLDHLLIKRK